MESLSKRIDLFILKTAVRFKNRAEAEDYGAKLPPEDVGPKWTHGDQKPRLGQPKPNIPKLPKLPKRESGKIGTPSTFFEEVAHQLTPKGPGYHAPEEIASDIKESKRLAGKITSIGKKPEGK